MENSLEAQTDFQQNVKFILTISSSAPQSVSLQKESLQQL